MPDVDIELSSWDYTSAEPTVSFQIAAEPSAKSISHIDRDAQSAREPPLQANELRRGVLVSELLSGFGRVVRMRADDLTVAQRAELYSVSHGVHAIDMFISHVCRTPGIKKYITLVVDRLGIFALLTAAVVPLMLFVLDACCQDLVRLGSMGVHFSMLLGGVIAAWVACAFGHVLCRCTYCFYDCACICQSDPELKAAGIRNIPAIIRTSRELVVLWDENYLTRLWCVYELAVAQSVGIPIRILPIDMYALLFESQILWAASSVCHMLVEAQIRKISAGPYPYMGVILVFIPFYACQAYAGRRCADVAAKLQEQLEVFDVHSAAISVESDRDLIFVGIEEMFGSLSNFNDRVRTSLKSASMCGLIGQTAMISYWGMLWQLLPSMPLLLSAWAGILHSSVPDRYGLPRCVFEATLRFGVVPVCIAGAMELGKRFTSGVRPAGAWAALAYASVGVLIPAIRFPWAFVVRGVPAWIGASGYHWLGEMHLCTLITALAMNGLTWVAAVWVFHPQRQSTQQ
uniref:Uncharacterized protein n=1 Tax=Zooxanthella nutricula TaxID=1333877 RepID=A0A7S2Q0H7_9DINO